jgi:hypothetical protein
MAVSAKSRKNDKWLKQLGENINQIILDKGYRSPYEFWVEKVGDDISRAGLNFILAGKRDPRITTLKLLGEALNVHIEDMLPKSR